MVPQTELADQPDVQGYVFVFALADWNVVQVRMHHIHQCCILCDRIGLGGRGL